MSVVTINGVDGSPGNAGLSGGAGGAAMAKPAATADSSNTVNADAGAGGDGGAAGSNGVAGAGGVGGAATAAVKTAAADSLGAAAVATAHGGAGGAAGVPGDPTTQGAAGAAGGASTASASDTNAAGAATATALAVGGSGGNGQGMGSGGAAGVAQGTKASAFGLGAATASVTQTAGDGGAGGGQGVGATGGPSTLRNAVTGSTQGGVLTLTQIARGGAGGTSHAGTPGAGGKASSTLIFDDTTQVFASRSTDVDAGILAYGGDGGTGNANFGGASGGDSAATANITGTGAVQADAEAYGGSEGAVFSRTVPHGGGATALATGVGRVVTVTAYAWGGTGQVGGGVATATAKGVGSSGSTRSTSVTSRVSSGLITLLSATTTAPVAGTSTVYTYAHLGGVGPTSVSGDQGVAAVVGAPSPAGTGPVLAVNPLLKSGFGAKPVYFASAELAGGYGTNTGAAEVSTSEIDMTVNLSLTPNNQDLIIGLYSPVATGAGFASLSLDVTANGTNILHQAFTSLADAMAYFSDHAVDTGWSPTSSPAGAGGSAQIDVILSLTTASPGDGFTANLLVGDAKPSPAPTHAMASAMAAMGASSSAGLTALSSVGPGLAPTLSLASSAAA